MSVVLPKGVKLSREDVRWYKLDRVHGTKIARRTLKLFRMNHTSLKKVFKYLRPDTVKLLKFAFGTDVERKTQSRHYYKMFGTPKNSDIKLNYGSLPGQRLSVREIDTKVLRMFARDFLTRNRYDGVYISQKISSFHRKAIPSRIFITRPVATLKNVRTPSAPVKKHPSLQEMFVGYTSGTTRLARPYRNGMTVFLSGGMAIKLYLRARNGHVSKRVADTSDFDFKFAVPRSLKTQREIESHAAYMKQLMTSHMTGFIKYINSRYNLGSALIVKEIRGAPVNKAGGPNVKKLYKAYNFSVKMGPKSPAEELVDTSLVVYPSIDREHLNLKFSRMFGMGIPKLKYLWTDTVRLLAGSFVDPLIKLRNPLYGNKKEKGLKNTDRVRNLAILVGRSKDPLVIASKKLTENIIAKQKTAGEKNSRKILRLIDH
jgi:hypothetical protein